jgi:hypothetical protein
VLEQRPADDDVIEVRENHLQRLKRTAFIFAPFAVGAAVLFSLALANLLAGKGGAIIAVVFVGIIMYALSYESISAFRDLRSTPVDTEGEIRRIWSKGRIVIFGRVNYMLVDRDVFELSRESRAALEVGDRVSVQHWPRTNQVISIRRATESAVSNESD